MLRERGWVRATGGFWHGRSHVRHLTWVYLSSLEYGPSALIDLVRGESASLRDFWPDIAEFSLLDEPREYSVPIYFVLGRHDRTIVSQLAADYLESIRAPDKRTFWFENSAHSPIYEEPSRFAAVLDEIEARLASQGR